VSERRRCAGTPCPSPVPGRPGSVGRNSTCNVSWRCELSWRASRAVVATREVPRSASSHIIVSVPIASGASGYTAESRSSPFWARSRTKRTPGSRRQWAAGCQPRRVDQGDKDCGQLRPDRDEGLSLIRHAVPASWGMEVLGHRRSPRRKLETAAFYPSLAKMVPITRELSRYREPGSYAPKRKSG